MSSSSSVRLNPLSISKGQHFNCEICGSAALVICSHCRVTSYCSASHQSVDWAGIHEKICQLLGALRTLRPTLGSSDERARRNLTVQMSKHALIDLCSNESQKHLVAGNFELAIPGALQSLRFSMEVYGSGRIELVPAYLLLAESNLGLKRYKVAEEFLLYANWSVLKNPDCSNELKSHLYRNFGKLYASQGRFDDALKQLSCDVYYSALESGPEHIDTAGGYFYMAEVFLKKKEIENALAFYDKCVDIFYKFLINLRNRPDESIGDYLSEAHSAEAAEMLAAIAASRKKHLGAGHLATGEANYALGILKSLTGHSREARSAYEIALAIYKQQIGNDSEATNAVRRALQKLKKDEKSGGSEEKEEENTNESEEPAAEEKSADQNSAARQSAAENFVDDADAEEENEETKEEEENGGEEENTEELNRHARVLSVAEPESDEEALLEREEQELQAALEEEEENSNQTNQSEPETETADAEAESEENQSAS